MAYSETTQQVSAKAEALFTEAEVEAIIAGAKAITQHFSAKSEAEAEALITEAKAIITNFRKNRDGRELKERLLALGNAINPAHGSRAEKMFSALGFITGVVSDECELEKNISALLRAIPTY